MAALASLLLPACGGQDRPAPDATGSRATGADISHAECDPVYREGDTVSLHVYVRASAHSPIADDGVVTRTYWPATFQGMTLTRETEAAAGSVVQTHRYYHVGHGARTYYGEDQTLAGELMLRDVYTPPYAEAISLAGNESTHYRDTVVVPADGQQTAISMQRAYVGRDTVRLRNGKTFAGACHYRITQDAVDSDGRMTTVADEWRAPGVGVVKTVAAVGGIDTVTRELEAATVGGRVY
ncbi:hypothetical protein [Burkholderia lata]|uniref:hypothetical protein n=1 Tax=Burkholderia lata (strain ATCC 17760 / DSM 23089 / LMG 22485 / NCIMB 9086 / R18194 / 383) TaxID=482957 RepID=UPI001583EBF3|nr:hypothetical protein [Burkholderia lata]